MELSDWPTWQPLIDLIRQCAPPDTQVVEFNSNFSRHSWGGSFSADDDAARWDEHEDSLPYEDRITTRLFDVMADVMAKAPPDGVYVEGRADLQDPTRTRIQVVLPSSSFSHGFDGPIEELILIPDALPAPYRATARQGDAPVAPGADPRAVARRAGKWLPWRHGVSRRALARVERELGAPLSDEVRALYRAAGSGAVWARRSESSHDGFEIVPLDDTETRSQGLAAGRFAGWNPSASDIAVRDPLDRVQPLTGSPFWFVFGHDWGGSFYAVDLAPGPRGHRGQVLFLERHVVGAVLVAESLADLLAGRVIDQPGSATLGARSRLNRVAGSDLTAVTPETEVISIGTVYEPVDLSPVAGHPRVRTLTVDDGGLTDVSVAESFPRSSTSRSRRVTGRPCWTPVACRGRSWLSASPSSRSGSASPTGSGSPTGSWRCSNGR